MARSAQTLPGQLSKGRPAEVFISGKRLDDRGYEEFRPAFFDAGSHSKAAGSAYAELGGTKVMVAVFPPKERERREGYSSKGTLRCHIKRISFTTSASKKARQQPEEEEEASAVLQSSLEAAVQLDAFPKSVVTINCVVMESAGSELAILITAASLALADAGIPMFDLVAACQISRVKGQLLLDPSSDEAYFEDGGCLLAVMSSSKAITHLTVTGEWTGSQMKELLDLSLGACLQLDASLRDTLRESLQ